MNEEWRDIVGYERIYQVSDLGRVKSLSRYVRNNKSTRHVRERVLVNINRSKVGYLCVNLNKYNISKTISVHELVAIAFLGHKLGSGLVINHIDFDKTNNNKNNLQVVTVRKNSSHLIKKGSSKYTGVSWYQQTKKWVGKIRINGNLKHLGYFTKEIDAANAYKERLNELKNE